MPNRALAKREEARLFEAYERVLSGGGFPNPERAGCPGNEVLKAMALRRLEPEDVLNWIDHLGTCSPCFREYAVFRRQVEWRKRAAYLSMAAAVIIVVLSFGLWKWRAGPQPVITAHNHVIADLTKPLVLRGDQGPGKGPLVFPRGFDDVTFLLPEGTRVGTYEVAIFRQESGEALTRASANASIQRGLTTFKVTLDLSRISPGSYLVGIRPLGTDWGYYPVIMR